MQPANDQVGDRVGRLVGRALHQLGHVGACELAPEPREHVGDGRGVDPRDLSFGDRAIEQALGDRTQIRLVGVDHAPDAGHPGHVGREGERLRPHGFVGDPQVRAQRIEGRHGRVERLDGGAADAMQSAIGEREQQLVPARRDGVEGAQGAAHRCRHLGHGQLAEAVADELGLELVEQLELTRGELALGLA